MSPHTCDVTRRVDGFPRVSGDEPDALDVPTWTRQFSPRERG